MEVKGLSIKNYKAIKDLDAAAFRKTIVTGKNGVGKTTVADAITDILCDKMTDGTSASSVRPHDNNGEFIHNVPVVREIQAEIGGKVYAIKKTTEEKWRRPRGGTELVYDGTETTYSINGFEKKLKEYNEWLEANIAKPERIAFLMNPQVFINMLRKSTTDGRETLEKIAGFSVEKFVESHPEYAEIAELIGDNSIEAALKQFRKNRKAQQTALENEQKKLAYEKDRPLDLAEVDESRIPMLKAQVEELDKQIAEIKEYNNSQKQLAKEIQAQIFSLKEEKKEFEIQASVALRDEESRAKSELFDSEREHTAAGNKAREIKYDLDSKANEYRATEQELKAAESEKVKEVCPTCGQKLPETNVESVKEHLKSKRDGLAKKLAEIKAEGCKYKKDYDAALADVEAKRLVTIEKSNAVAEVQKKIQNFTAPEFPKDVELAGLADKLDRIIQRDYSEIQAEQNRIESEMRSIREKTAFNDTIKANKAKMISELECSVKSLANALGRIEQNIDTILHFSIDKNAALAEKINPYFNHFYFKFLEFTELEGNPVETCRIIEKATNTDYMNGLNHGSRIICEAELVAGFQKLNGIELPIIIDDSESVDTDKIPEVSQQVFILRRVDNEPLTVKEYSNGKE